MSTIGTLKLSEIVVSDVDTLVQLGTIQNSAGPLPTECIYALAGPCKIVNNVAGSLGAAAYEPMVFWASGVLCIIGLISQTVSGGNHRDSW